MNKWMTFEKKFLLSWMENLGCLKSWKVDPIWRMFPISGFLLTSSRKPTARGAARILGTSTLPVRQVNPTAFPSPAAVIYTNQEKQHSIHSSTWTPFPTRMLFLARDLPKETTSAEPLPTRSGESWGSWDLFSPSLDPSCRDLTGKRDGTQPDHHQQTPQCPGIMPVSSTTLRVFTKAKISFT